MIDKQTIINGVDVSKREHINTCDNKIKCVILQDDICETNPYCEGYNCYYKQLKRKEQECEELKKAVMYKCPQCGDEYLSPIGARLYEKNKKYEQILTEIKEIAKEDFNHTCWETYARQLKQILQKINECEVK